MNHVLFVAPHLHTYMFVYGEIFQMRGIDLFLRSHRIGRLFIRSYWIGRLMTSTIKSWVLSMITILEMSPERRA
mgnify:FL=1